MIMNKDDMKTLLQAGTVRIEFVKANGVIRTMQATLNSDIIPVTPVVENAGTTGATRKVNEFSLPVWDTEANGWRSFRWDSLRDVAGTMLPNGIS